MILLLVSILFIGPTLAQYTVSTFFTGDRTLLESVVVRAEGIGFSVGIHPRLIPTSVAVNAGSFPFRAIVS